MKDILEAIAVILVISATLALAFLFKGEPDLWDKMHEAAMAHYDKKGGAS